jgi:RNA polymerase sigma factor (TIGR02999 family)
MDEDGPDSPAWHALVALAYAELREIAQRLIDGKGDARRISPSSLVHMACLKLGDQRTAFQEQRHLLGVAAIAMRRLLVDQARARRAERRGGGLSPLSLEAIPELIDEPRFADPIEIEEALATLARTHPRPVEVVQYRLFGGLTVEETAAVLGLGPSQVKRDWNLAIDWLRQRWTRGDPGPAAHPAP